MQRICPTGQPQRGDQMANIIWTPPEGWVEESGAHVSFKSPCDCSAAGNLVIGSKSYSIVDAMGRTITGVGGAFVSGAILDFILDCENLKAYLQNSAQADYIVEQGTSSGWLYRKWNSGMVEFWGSAIDMTTQSGWVYWSASVPSGIYKTLQNDLIFAQNIYTTTPNRNARKWVLTVSGDGIYVRDGSGNMPSDGSYVSVSIYAVGTWK